MAMKNAEVARISLADAPDLAYQVGTGRVECSGETVHLVLGKNASNEYSDAQLDDYHQEDEMAWQPAVAMPVQMEVRARFSHSQRELCGTAGFGFWNDPFGMTQSRGHPRWLPRFRLPQVQLPQAVWFFFASPPSDMRLARDVPGYGWKAATLDASRMSAKALLPFAPLAMLACRSSFIYRRLWPLAERILKIDEKRLPVAMDQWHDYELVWEQTSARFFIDGALVLHTRYAPRGPLGFVAWIDNQYMVATPQGQLRHGVLACEEQQLEITHLKIAHQEVTTL